MWITAELGLEVDRTDIGGPFGGNDKPEYLALNPNGRVPTIIDGDHVQWESNSIVRYLVEREGAAPWFPGDLKTRAMANMWMDWVTSSMTAVMVPLYWGLIRTAEEDRDYDAIEAARIAFGDLFKILDAHLENSEYITGPEINMGDIPAACFVYRWYTLDIERSNTPNVRAWYDRIADRPAFQQHVMLPLV
jgi:glutathione S-transferase